jgi:hypothetical protein
MKKYLPPHPFDKDAHPFSSTAYTPSAPYIYTPKIKKKKDVIDISDTTQTNSMADIISNTVFGRTPVSELPSEIWDLYTKLTWEPIASGVKSGYGWAGFGKALLNNLNAVGEDIDAITGANIIKALAFDQQGLDSIKSAVGFDGPRKQFDASNYVDTGNVAGDFGLSMLSEVAMDPTTWLTLGVSAGVKAGASTLKSTIKSAVKSFVTDDDVAEAVAKAAAKHVYKGTDIESALKAGYNVAKDKTNILDFYKAVDGGLGKTIADTYNAAGRVSIPVIQGLNKMVDGVNNVSSLPLKALWYTTGIPEIYRGIKWYKKSVKYMDNILTNTVAQTLNQFPNATAKDYVELIKPIMDNNISKLTNNTLTTTQRADAVALYMLTARSEPEFIQEVADTIIKSKTPQNSVEIFDRLFIEKFKVPFEEYVQMAHNVDVERIHTHIDNLRQYRDLVVSKTNIQDVREFADAFVKIQDIIEEAPYGLSGFKNLTLKEDTTENAFYKLVDEVLVFMDDAATKTYNGVSVIPDSARPKFNLLHQIYREVKDLNLAAGDQVDLAYETASAAVWDIIVKNVDEAGAIGTVRLPDKIFYNTNPIEKYEQAMKYIADDLSAELKQVQATNITLSERELEEAVLGLNIMNKYRMDLELENAIGDQTVDMLKQAQSYEAGVKELFTKYMNEKGVSPSDLANPLGVSETEATKAGEQAYLIRKEYIELSLQKVSAAITGVEETVIGLSQVDSKSWRRMVGENYKTFYNNMRELILVAQKFLAPHKLWDVTKMDELGADKFTAHIMKDYDQYTDYLTNILDALAHEQVALQKEYVEHIKNATAIKAINATESGIMGLKFSMDNVTFTDSVNVKVEEFLEFLQNPNAVKDPTLWLKFKSELEDIVVPVSGRVYKESVSKTDDMHYSFSLQSRGTGRTKKWKKTSPAIMGDMKTYRSVQEYNVNVFEDIKEALKDVGIDLDTWIDLANMSINNFAKESLLDDAAMYITQLSKNTVSKNIIYDQRIVDFVVKLQDPTSDTAFKLKLIDDALNMKAAKTGEAVEGRTIFDRFRGAVRRHELVANLFYKIRTSELTRPFRQQIIDILLTDSRAPIDFALRSRTAYVDRVLEGVRTQSVAQGQLKKLALDKIVDELPDVEKADIQRFFVTHGVAGLQAHEARYDITVLKWLLEKKPEWFNPETIELYKQGKIVLYDIETTSLNSGPGQIWQIGFYDADGKLISYTNKDINTSGIQPYMYDKLPGGSRDGLHNFVGDTNQHTVVFKSEAELLDGFITHISPKGVDSDAVRLMGWNSAEFDAEFISDRLRDIKKDRLGNVTSLKGTFEAMIQHDGYLERLKNIDGIPTMSADQIGELRRFINTFLDQRIDEADIFGTPFYDTPLYDTFTKATIEDLNSFLRSEGADLAQHASNRAEFLDAITLTEELSGIRDAFVDILRGVSTVNKADLHGAYIVKNTDGALVDFMGHAIGPEGALHVMQLFSREVGAPYVYGVRKLYDKQILYTYLGVTDGTELSFTEKTNSWRFAKRADKLFNKVSKLILPKEYAQQAIDSLRLAKEWLLNRPITETFSHMGYVKHINPNGFGTAELTRYITLQTLVQDVARRGNVHKETLLKHLEANNVDLKFIKLLRDPSEMFGFDITKMQEYIDTFWHFNKQEPAAHLEKFYGDDSVEGSILTDITLLKQHKASLGTILDMEGFAGVEARMQIAIIDQYLDVLAPLEEKLSKLSPAQYASIRQDALQRSTPDTFEAVYNQMVERELIEKAMILKEKLMRYSELRHTTEIVYLKNLSPEALAENLFLHRQSYITFNTGLGYDSITRAIMEDVSNAFVQNAGAYQRAGIRIRKAGDRIWVGLSDSKSKMNWWQNELVPKHTDEELARPLTRHGRNKMIRERLEKLGEVQEAYLKAHPVYDESFQLDLDSRIVEVFGAEDADVLETLSKLQKMTEQFTRGASVGSAGEMYNKATHQKVMLNYAPAEIKVLLSDTDDVLMHNFNFNKSIIGGVNSRQEILEFVSGNIIKNYFNAAQSMLHTMEARSKLLQMMFNDHLLSPTGDLLRNVPVEIIYENILNNDDYVLAGLVQDKAVTGLDNLNPNGIIKAFDVSNIEQLKQIINHSATVENLHLQIMPVQQYLYAVDKINNFKITNTAVKILNEYIIGPMKTGYLTSLGFIFRNIVDTGLKNQILAGSGNQVSMLRNTMETWRMYKRYEDIMKKMQTFDDGVIKNSTGSFSNRVLERMYQTDPGLEAVLSKDMFHIINDFIQQGPSAGVSNIQKEIILKTITKKREASGAQTPMYQYIMDNPVTHKVMSVNSDIEQIYRLSAYMWELQHGSNTTEAMSTVLKYHFDYKPKTRAQYYVDYVVPFAAFTQNNVLFWMDMLERPGYLGKLFTDYYQANWSAEDRKQMQYNMAMQYHAAAGNLSFGNFVVKLNPSALDVVRTLTDPYALMEKIAAYIKVPIEVLIDIARQDTAQVRWTLLSNLPIIGVAAMKYGKSVPKALAAADGPLEQLLVTLVPSMFSAIAEKEWARKLYYRKLYVKRGKKYMPKHKKAKRVYPRKTFAPKSYMKKQYLDRIMQNPARKIMRIASNNAIKKGTTGLKAKMIPTSYLEYKKRLRANWKFIRNS